MANTLDKALEIVSELLNGEEIRRGGTNAGLYEEFALGTEVYDKVVTIFKKLNIELYEYNDGLYITAGENNRVFGYSNEELKKEIGIKLNRELYLCYFIIYQIMGMFYPDSGKLAAEYLKSETVIKAVDEALAGIIRQLKELSLDEVEENSFKEIAYLWEDMPLVQTEEAAVRASRGSKSGFTKLVFNFLTAQELLIETDGRYYPRERFLALLTHYYDEHKGRLWEITKAARTIKGTGETQDAAD